MIVSLADPPMTSSIVLVTLSASAMLSCPSLAPVPIVMWSALVRPE
jgi:hypothetical protein